MTRGERVLRGAFAGLAFFAVLSHAILLAGGSVHAMWAPLCFTIGVASQRPWRGLRYCTPAPPRWATAATWIVLAIALAALAWGALATPSRHWDGLASWDLRADALRAAPTLEQTFFRAPGVNAHSREYPLLLPLLEASLGRSVLVAAWAVLVLAGAVAFRRAGVAPLTRCALIVCTALVPMLVAPTSGSVDSGYADAFVAMCLTAVATAVITGDLLLLGCAVLVLPFIKPEGAVYAAVVTAACWLSGSRTQLATTTAAAAAGLALWMPLYLDLSASAIDATAAVMAIAIGAAIAIGTRLAADRFPGRWARPALALAVALVAIVLSGSGAAFGGVLGTYLGGDAKLGDAPAAVAGLAREMVDLRKLGLTFPALVVALAVSRPSPALIALIGLGLASLVPPFLLSPEDLSHHLRSSADRLLMQWSGVAWVVIGSSLQPADHAQSTSPRRELGDEL